jgi:hypothetical protein
MLFFLFRNKEFSYTLNFCYILLWLLCSIILADIFAEEKKKKLIL